MLERSSPVPLYHQLKELLAAKIRKGEWKAGDLIPGEQELQAMYALSRTTVRQSLRELELDGTLTRHRGRGTFVARPKLTHDPDPARGLASPQSGASAKASWRVLDAAWIPAPTDVATRLHVPKGERVHRLQRVRLVENEPIGHHTAYVPQAFADSISPAAFKKGTSLQYLEKNPALRGASLERVLEALGASDEEADLLQVDEGDPVLSIRRLLVSSAGVPIEHCRCIYRGDRFQYHFRTEWKSEERPLE